MSEKLKAPFPWFGGKRQAADLVWARLGDVNNYVEPFFGSGAVLLARHWSPGVRHRETINDANRYLANFWRALQYDFEGVVRHCDYPVSEVDLTARHRWLVTRGAAVLEALDFENDPSAFDARIAGWWVWGLGQWIGSGWCEDTGGAVWERYRKGSYAGVHGQMPFVGAFCNGSGGHQAQPSVQMPDITGDQHGRGVHNLMGTSHTEGLRAWLGQLSERLRFVRVCCGDWSRVCTGTATDVKGRALTGVFLDPPYEGHGGVYRHTDGELTVSEQVRAWCVEAGARPTMRVALCGYEGEHNDLEALGWSKVEWKAGGGYANRGGKEANANARAERIWFSPACLDDAQQVLF